jgi:hypothetical protein
MATLIRLLENFTDGEISSQIFGVYARLVGETTNE